MRQKRGISNLRSRLYLEIKSHIFIYLALFGLLLEATFLRVTRTNQILGFYFDQGRDALVISDLLQHGKWFLIGPTTGIAGIFRGPFYYYLITPFYWIGRGNPVFPAIFLALTSVLALLLLYYLAKEVAGRGAGLIAVCIATFSYYLVYASRWLSNPTPMLLLSLLLFWMMVLIQKGKSWAWIVLSFIAGSSLFHFGSSGEFFYLPAILVFALWQWGVFSLNFKFPKLVIIFGSILAFISTAAPLVIFDLRHDRILSHNILQFFVKDGSFKASFWAVAQARIQFFVEGFYNKVFLSRDALSTSLMWAAIIAGVLSIKIFWTNVHIRALILLLISPIIGLMFFQGNQGNIYDYYLTGYYLPFILFLSICVYQFLRVRLVGILFVILFLLISYKENIEPSWSLTHNPIDGPTTIAFGNERQAVSWVYENANGSEFNVDEYVPPVIPYTYDYLFSWYGRTLNGNVTERKVSLLYTLYEVDPPHPERLKAWLDRQQGIGIVQDEVHFGGITVQRRTRITIK